MKTFIVGFVFIFIHVCTLSLLQLLGAEQTLVPHQMPPALLVQPSVPELTSATVLMPDLASASTLPEMTKKRHRRKRINIPKKGHWRKMAVAHGLDEHAAVPRLMYPPTVDDPIEPACPTELPALHGPVVPGLDQHSAVPRLMYPPAADNPTEPAGPTELPALPGPVVPGLDQHAAVPRLMYPPAVDDPTEPAGPMEASCIARPCLARPRPACCVAQADGPSRSRWPNRASWTNGASWIAWPNKASCIAWPNGGCCNTWPSTAWFALPGGACSSAWSDIIKLSPGAWPNTASCITWPNGACCSASNGFCSPGHCDKSYWF